MYVSLDKSGITFEISLYFAPRKLMCAAMQSQQMPLFISCPGDLEYLLSDELTSLGLAVTKTSPMGIYGDADLETIYRICLWSRVANRVQLILAVGQVRNADAVYEFSKTVEWEKIFSEEKTLAVEFHGQSDFIRNTMFGAQRVKDGIVDYFRTKGARPDVDKVKPNIRIHAHLHHNQLTLSLDLVGYSLHQRGYRQLAGGAPIKENVAAAMLIRAGWPDLAKQNYNLVDPFCGSGTILIEGALMATETAPGLLRNDQALVHWLGHQPDVWTKMREDAQKKRQPLSNKIFGFDNDADVLIIAENNAKKAGCDSINFNEQSIENFQTIPGQGLFIANPPFGERLDDPNTLIPLYQNIGKALYQHCQGWQAAILTSNTMLAQAIGLRVNKKYSIYNGAIKAKLYCYQLDETNRYKFNHEKKFSAHGEMLFNRLIKNKKHLAKWLKRTDTSCYRLYDADIPEYAFAIDVYNDWAHVQEYAPPLEIPAHKAEQRVLDMLQVLPEVLGIPADHIALKQRKRQKGKEQYQTFDNKNETITVTEGAAKLKVNLFDYIDTGLFLDHRLLRLMFSQNMQGKRFLNCFCYTGTASVHAALSGASTTNVDLSNTYLSWAEDNFRLNSLSLHDHHFIQADCLVWLEKCNERFDVIFLDPPSFSNSKRMTQILDIQRDHEELINNAMKLLNHEGVLYFSCNLKTFKLSESVQEKYKVKNITAKTLDEDFKNSTNIHHAFAIYLN